MATVTVDLPIPFVFATLFLNAIVQLETGMILFLILGMILLKDAIVLTTKILTDTKIGAP
jgi:hypothetical protein